MLEYSEVIWSNDKGGFRKVEIQALSLLHRQGLFVLFESPQLVVWDTRLACYETEVQSFCLNKFS